MIRNRRDLGGIQTKDGRTIRPGMLIRSALLSQAEEEELEGIASVIDLRTSGERAEESDKVYDLEYLPIPVFDTLTVGISHESGSEEQRIPDMDKLYQQLMRECKESFRKVLLTIMEHDYSNGAILWHCSEGKDRCGITAALVLEMLGVDRETIMEDYLKTNQINLPKAERIRSELIETRGEAFADNVYQAYIADAKYLEAAWEAMGEHYIQEELEIPEEMIHAFRDKILMDKFV